MSFLIVSQVTPRNGGGVDREEGASSFPHGGEVLQFFERQKRRKSYLENVYAKDALSSSEKTFVLPKLEDIKAKVNCDLNMEVQPGRGAQSTLRKEILQLEKHLKDQQLMRGALEKALGPDATPVNLSVENPMPKAANELIREIATLELEVKNMEQLRSKGNCFSAACTSWMCCCTGTSLRLGNFSATAAKLVIKHRCS